MTSAPRALAVASVTSLALALSACGYMPTCNGSFQQYVDPAQRTLAVGQSYVPKAWRASCGGKALDLQYGSWRAADPSVVQVDSATGRTTGRHAGTTRVIFTSSETAGEISGEVTVQ